MTPNKQLLKLAKQKAKKLNTQQTIRLEGMGFEKSYYVFNFSGFNYIGSYENEKLGKFFKNKEVYEMRKNNVDPIIATMQLLDIG